MCQVCALWEKGKLTKPEVLNAFGELIGESDGANADLIDHAWKALDRIFEEEGSDDT